MLCHGCCSLPKKSFQKSPQDKAERLLTCLQLWLQQQTPQGCDAMRQRLELGAPGPHRAPPPPGALTISRLSAESGTSCTAMVSDSHAQTLLHSQSAWALGDCKASTNTCQRPATNPDSVRKRLKMKTGHVSHGVGEVRGMLGRRGGNWA